MPRRPRARRADPAVAERGRSTPASSGRAAASCRGCAASSAATGEGPSWDDVEETLIAGDVGAALAIDLVERARARRDPGGAGGGRSAPSSRRCSCRATSTGSPRPAVAGGPAVVLVVGVNGTGKTTTIGKLASRYAAEGRSRASSPPRTRSAPPPSTSSGSGPTGPSVPVVAHAPGADPGAVVYDALDAAVARGADLVIADTAGRLHTKSNLMDELTKIRRIIDKRLPGAEPETLFVLDATTGQNGLAQAKAFHEAVGLTGIVLTKLDSTAKGGIVFAIEDALKVPVRFVGVGEGVDDLIAVRPRRVRGGALRLDPPVRRRAAGRISASTAIASGSTGGSLAPSALAARSRCRTGENHRIAAAEQAAERRQARRRPSPITSASRPAADASRRAGRARPRRGTWTTTRRAPGRGRASGAPTTSVMS